MHGFSSADSVNEVADGGGDGRSLIVLYVGDFDPSGCTCHNVICPAAR